MPSGNIASKISQLPESPGIYQFFSKEGKILYIGKAKNLRNRVIYYTKSDLSLRLSRMVFLVHIVEYITTASEAEALLLEARLIKKYQPQFNILLKDDKSFPYIILQSDHQYPQILKKRSKRPPCEEHFGPFASSKDVDTTLLELQKIFKLRSCNDAYFANRKRPCLQYQIGRCTAPCVGKITHEEYMNSVNEVHDFLSGKMHNLQENLAQKMKGASDNLDYEKAAIIRDKIKALSYVQMQYGKQQFTAKKVDLILCSSQNNTYAVLVAFYRNGQYFGNNVYFPENINAMNESDVIAYFIETFYLNLEQPDEIIVNHQINNKEFLDIEITYPIKGSKLHLIKSFEDTLSKALQSKTQMILQKQQIFTDIQKLFNLEKSPERIEIYDNSHLMGKDAIAAMVVAGPNGFLHREYRAYNVESSNLHGGDDYDMFRQIFIKRISKIITQGVRPDFIIIDGGIGQMNVICEVMNKFDVHIPFVCMSKGPDRNAGLEQFHMPNHASFTLEKNDKILHYMQILRDEAHNFAIKKHRSKRSKRMYKSILDNIEGCGTRRKKDLLDFFGSIDGIKNASIQEIAKIPGIGIVIAEKIYKSLKNH